MKNSSNVYRYEYSKLVMFIPLFFIIMPRPAIGGIQFLTYPAIFLVIVFLLLNLTKDIRLNKNVFSLFVFLFLIALVMVFSMAISPKPSLESIAKPILFASLLYYGYFITKNKDIDTIKNSLRYLAYIAIFIQAVVGLTQLFGIDVFAPLYSMEKTRAWGGIVRIAGTMSNPNIFSWVLIQMSAILWLFERKIFKKTLFVVVALCLVFLSGSRSMLLIFPFVILFIEVISKRKTPVFFLFKVPLYGILLFGAYRFTVWFLTKFGASFPYMYQLLSIFETGELDSINSFDYRLYMWDRSLSQLTTPMDWLFGSGGVIGKADNDYVYAISNFGITYLVIQLLMYFWIAYFFFKLKDRKFKSLGLQYIVFSLVIGYQADTLSGWNYPILIMFYAGIAISLLANGNKSEDEGSSENKKIRKRYKIVW